MDPNRPHGDARGAGAPTERPRLGLRYAALSDVGRVRKDNQDSGFASGHLLVIADGVGGAARGDVASSTAVLALRRLDGPPPADMLEALAGAIHRAHDRIAELVDQDPELEGTSTTVTSALFDGHRLAVAHIGDSRGYLLRDGTLSQLTKDHTFVQSLVDEGRITEVESRTHPHRNLILRAVDGVNETDPDLFYLELAPGDRLLLCSDGASGVLDPDRLADILGTGSVDYAVVELVRAALDAGSSDNVTCVVADVVSLDAEQDGSAGPEAAAGGPLLVGAAAEQARPGARSFFRGHRSGDTDELEPVPAEEGDGDHADPEDLRYAPQEPRRGRWGRRVAGVLVVVVVLVLAGVVAYRWSQTQYFVAAQNGKVAIFRGVQADMPGISLNHVVQDTGVTVAALPDYPTEQVSAGISAESLADARGIVSRLTGLATVCPSPTPTAGPTVTASPRVTTGTAAGSASPAARPSASPSASPSARPSAGPSATPSAGAGAPSPSARPTASGGTSAAPTVRPPNCIEATP